MQFTTSDGYPLHVHRDAPAGPARGRVVCLHGIQSHGGWYRRSAALLAQAGFDTYFPDRRGSGLNSQARGDCPSFRRLLDDVVEFVRHLRSQDAGASPVPTFLAGISWGGKLAVGVQYRAPGLVDGLALLCPGLVARVSPPLGVRVRVTLCKYALPRRAFPIPLSDPKLFTASPQWQQFLRDDPLALHLGTARLLSESFLLDLYLRRARKWVTAPTLLMLGGRDQILDNARTRAFVESFPAADKTILEYPDSEHTLEFEPEGHPFVDDLIGWLGARTQLPSTRGGPAG